MSAENDQTPMGSRKFGGSEETNRLTDERGQMTRRKLGLVVGAVFFLGIAEGIALTLFAIHRTAVTIFFINVVTLAAMLSTVAIRRMS